MPFSSKTKSVRIEIGHIEALSSAKNDMLLAGASKADITPQPRMPLAGYSVMASDGMGFRTRLYARALYIKPKVASPVALVQCDLLSGSRLLHHRVAELIAKETDISAAGLLIAATHTHSGPGNFFGSNFYNRYASNSAGFEKDFFDFLSGQVASAVIQAYKNRRPARVATGKIEVRRFTRNRSIKAYHANKNVSKESPPDIYRAINPYMYMIRIDCMEDNGTYKPVGAFSSFSIHGTAVPIKNHLYSGDVFAYIEREVEWAVKDRYKTSWEPVHAAANCTHGDHSPDYRSGMQGFIEARRIGQAIGKKAFELFVSLDDRLTNDVTIRFISKEIDVYEQPCIDGSCLCKRPVVGNALIAGAEDGPSPVINSLPFFKEGWPRWVFTGSCQGHKRVLAGPLQRIILLRKDFPHHMFFQVIQIDDTVLLPVPFEVTWEMGRRIATQCRQEALSSGMDEARNFVVISCSNGYFGYVTTPEEYTKQHYEGGHTLYGPGTGSFLATHLGHMVSGMVSEGCVSELPDQRVFNLRTSKFYARDVVPEGKRQTKGPPAFHTSGKNREPYWSFRWYDLPPNLIEFHKPLVMMEESKDGKIWAPLVVDGRPIDDRGYDISVTFCSKISRDNMGLYEARWYNPVIKGDRCCRFVILPRQRCQVLTCDFS